jgi:hypothetical protein
MLANHFYINILIYEPFMFHYFFIFNFYYNQQMQN